MWYTRFAMLNLAAAKIRKMKDKTNKAELVDLTVNEQVEIEGGGSARMDEKRGGWLAVMWSKFTGASY